MKQGPGINEEVRSFIQEWFVKPQLLHSEDDDVREERAEGLKKIIQKGFLRYALMQWDNLKALLEDDEEMNALYEAIEKKESSKQARKVFEDAISDVKKEIAPRYGLAPKRKMQHEILAERLNQKFGEDHINQNINNLIQKNIGNSGEVDCEGGSCGC